MGGKHCNLQCFGASYLPRRLEPLKQHELLNLKPGEY